MFYLIIGILGLAFLMKNTVVELLENLAALILCIMDKAWNAIFN